MTGFLRLFIHGGNLELVDFSEVPLVRRFSPRKGKKKLVPGEDEDPEKGSDFPSR